MRFCLGIMAICCLAPASSLAQALKAQPGTETLCTGFEETVEGHWRNGEVPALLFRFSSNRDGSGCYAWLNALPAWEIKEPGSIELKQISRSGGKRDTGCAVFDLDTKKATFNCGGGSALGEITAIK